jgi:hypothetical protein
MAGKVLRVAVISTGGVGAIAGRAVHRRGDLELVGVWVHGTEKVGVDAGTLVGIDPIGVVVGIDPIGVVAAPAGVTTSLELPMTVPRDPLG